MSETGRKRLKEHLEQLKRKRAADNRKLHARYLYIPRSERRRLTLEAAKKASRTNGMTRREMHLYRDDLMKMFPKGTLREDGRIGAG